MKSCPVAVIKETINIIRVYRQTVKSPPDPKGILPAAPIITYQN